MNRKRLSAALFIVPVFLAVLLLAGCGGGGNQSQNGGSQGGGGGPGGGKQGEAAQAKTALGKIVVVDADKGKIVLRPTAQAQGSKRMIFIVTKNAKITLDGKEAKLADIKTGLQAKVSYFVDKVVNKDTNKSREVNRARIVSAFSGGEGNKKGGKGGG